VPALGCTSELPKTFVAVAANLRSTSSCGDYPQLAQQPEPNARFRLGCALTLSCHILRRQCCCLTSHPLTSWDCQICPTRESSRPLCHFLATAYCRIPARPYGWDGSTRQSGYL
jgi:hypothetical protein